MTLQSCRSFCLGFDFDGTLSPIVKEPEQATLQPDIAEILKGLVKEKDTVIAVLSGRSLEDLQRKVNLPNVTLAGDHGLRIKVSDGEIFQPDNIPPLRDLFSQIKRIREVTNAIAGVQLEPKEFSLNVHYRNADVEISGKLRDILNELVEGTSFHLQPGRMC